MFGISPRCFNHALLTSLFLSAILFPGPKTSGQELGPEAARQIQAMVEEKIYRNSAHNVHPRFGAMRNAE